jgi:predicted nuclease of predicted toxin-antitoxin system
VAEPIRYYMDQHYPASVTEGLRRRGVDVLTAQEAERCGLPDPEQLAFATVGDRVMVTFDSDYLALQRSGISHAGVA